VASVITNCHNYLLVSLINCDLKDDFFIIILSLLPFYFVDTWRNSEASLRITG
jgi:hypothetical protein